MTAMMAYNCISRWSGALGVCAIVTIIRPALAEPRAVVELFTSQGCSSCPPADKVIGELAKDPSVIALSMPIDYWDYLGWKDTLADARFSARQQAYSRVRGDRGVYTPNDAFFVRWHLSDIPQRVDASSHRIAVTGEVDHPLSLSLDDLAALPQVEVSAVNQCSGNGRGLSSPRVAGGQWDNGAMGNAIWTGVRLRDVVDRAGLKPTAKQVQFHGLEGPVLPTTPAFRKSLDVARARRKETECDGCQPVERRCSGEGRRHRECNEYAAYRRPGNRNDLHRRCRNRLRRCELFGANDAGEQGAFGGSTETVRDADERYRREIRGDGMHVFQHEPEKNELGEHFAHRTRNANDPAIEAIGHRPRRNGEQ